MILGGPGKPGIAGIDTVCTPLYVHPLPTVQSTVVCPSHQPRATAAGLPSATEPGNSRCPCHISTFPHQHNTTSKTCIVRLLSHGETGCPASPLLASASALPVPASQPIGSSMLFWDSSFLFAQCAHESRPSLILIVDRCAVQLGGSLRAYTPSSMGITSSLAHEKSDVIS